MYEHTQHPFKIYCPPPQPQLKITSYPQSPPHHTQVQSHLTGSSLALFVRDIKTRKDSSCSLDLLRDASRGHLVCSVRSSLHFTKAALVLHVAGISKLPQDIGWLFSDLFICASPCLLSQQNVSIQLYHFSSFPILLTRLLCLTISSFTGQKFGPLFAHIDPSLVTE